MPAGCELTVMLQLKAILSPFMPVAALNNDTQSTANIEYAAIVKLRRAHMLPAKDVESGASAAPKSWSRSIMPALILVQHRGEKISHQVQ